MRYSIEGQELTDIADALRRRHGETEIVESDGPTDMQIVASKDSEFSTHVSNFDNLGGTYNSFYTVVDVPLANKIKVKIAYNLSGYETRPANQFVKIATGDHSAASGNVDNMPTDSILLTGIGQQEFEFETNKLTIYFNYDNWYLPLGYGFYAECYSYGSKEVPRTYQSNEMAQAIDDIPPSPPAEAFVITGDCTYRFGYNNLNWFINLYGDRITTKDITNCNSMFYNSGELLNIPFDIHYKLPKSGSIQNIMNSMFTGTNIQPPKIFITSELYNGKKNQAHIEYMTTSGSDRWTWDDQFIFVDENTQVVGVDYNIFTGSNFVEAPTWFYDLIDLDASRALTSTEFGGRFPMHYNNCNYLKSLDLSMFWSDLNGYYGSYYGFTTNNCFSLISVILPRPSETAAETSNQFGNKFSSTHSLRHVTFDTKKDGSPYVAKWKAQTIDATPCGIYCSNQSAAYKILDQNKKVTNDEDYQRLKNEPDWWNGEQNSYSYCPYNHDSAVETINSLPDTSAYIAANGGTNTIKFKGVAGYKTDGGAINTLTEEEIAVATAKGWTVTLA